MKTVKDLTAEDWVILRLMFFRLRPNDHEIRRLELHRSLEFLLKKHNPRTIVEAMEMISKEGSHNEPANTRIRGMKTNELTGAALDWAVAKAWQPVYSDKHLLEHAKDFHPSTDWAHGGPIIEREKIEWQWLPSSEKSHQYGARKPSLGGLNRTFCMDGPTVLVAAMRCYVASCLGDEVNVPEELK